MTEPRSTESADRCSRPTRDRRNERRIIVWSALWALSFLAATLASERGWFPSPVAAIAAVVASAGFGAGTLVAYRRFLAEADELRRKIEVEALAVAYGVGVVGGLTFWLLEQASVVSDARLPLVIVAMLLTHPAGVVIGRRRYR